MKENEKKASPKMNWLYKADEDLRSFENFVSLKKSY